jgi:hypothetical protein
MGDFPEISKTRFEKSWIFAYILESGNLPGYDMYG